MAHPRSHIRVVCQNENSGYFRKEEGKDIIKRAKNSATPREFFWDLRQAHLMEHHISSLDTVSQSLILPIFQRFLTVRPILLHARSGLIHGDIKDSNTLVHDGNLSGIIDFSDTCFSAHVCNLAIAIAQFLGTDRGSLSRVAHLVAGYQSVFPLSEEEFVLLPLLTATRLATLFVGATHFSQKDPENAYLREHISSSLASLKFLLQVGFDEVLRVFRNVLPKSPQQSTFLKQ